MLINSGKIILYYTLLQEYAATTMSELLGWYGYDKVDSGCTRSLNLDHFTSTPNTRNNRMFKMDQNFISNKQTTRSPISLNIANSSFDISSLPLPYSTNNLTTINKQLISPPLSLKKISLNSTSKFLHTNESNSICSGKLKENYYYVYKIRISSLI